MKSEENDHSAAPPSGKRESVPRWEKDKLSFHYESIVNKENWPLKHHKSLIENSKWKDHQNIGIWNQPEISKYYSSKQPPKKTQKRTQKIWQMIYLRNIKQQKQLSDNYK